MNPDALRMLKHELRTPVNHIIGYSELLLEAAEDDGIDSITAQARELHKDAQEVAAIIEKHFLNTTWQDVETCCSSLWGEVAPALRRIIRSSHSFRNQSSGSWAQDFERINLAAERLAKMIHADYELDEIAGGRVIEFLLSLQAG